MKTRTFRPTALNPLEDRTVPSGFGIGGFGDFEGGHGGGLSGALNPKGSQDVQAINQAIRQFEVSYISDVDSILFNGGTPSATTQTNFNTAITTLTGNLTATLTGAVTNLNSSTLNTAIQTALTNLTTTLTGDALPGSGRFSEFSYIRQGVRQINSALSNVDQQTLNTLPTGAITPTTLQSALSSISTAVQTFKLAYYQAVQTDLLGTTQNTTQFKTDVTAAVTTLSGSITTAVSTLGSAFTASAAGTALTTTLGNITSSLQTSLTGLTPPSTSGFLSQWIFKWESNFYIRSAAQQVNQAVEMQAIAYNGTL
jgi:hypothetical protein